MLKIIAIALVLVIVGILIFASTRPDTFSISRSIVIKVGPEKIFPMINNFQHWKSWSPWEPKDPKMERTFSGANMGVGSVYAWNGNNDVGQGQMEIVESVEPSKISIKLDFFKPFEAHNMAEFTLSSVDGGTHINWEMRGPQPFIGKLMCLFMDMEKMVGPDFETGLANIKSQAEAQVLQ